MKEILCAAELSPHTSRDFRGWEEHLAGTSRYCGDLARWRRAPPTSAAASQSITPGSAAELHLLSSLSARTRVWEGWCFSPLHHLESVSVYCRFDLELQSRYIVHRATLSPPKVDLMVKGKEKVSEMFSNLPVKGIILRLETSANHIKSITIIKHLQVILWILRLYSQFSSVSVFTRLSPVGKNPDKHIPG